MSGNLLFEIIISRECNKRCEYCWLDFKKKFINYDVINNFLEGLEKLKHKKKYIHINFFGGEPLLGKDRIKYIIEQMEKINIEKNYSVVTNGLLIDNFFLELINKYNIQTEISIDTNNNNLFKYNKKIKEIKNKNDNLMINYIFIPGKLNNIEETNNYLEYFGIKNINIMPVYTTMNRYNENLDEFVKVVKWFINKNENKNINFFKYDRGFSSENQFILEHNGDVYQDVDSDIWLQKQYNIVPNEVYYKSEHNCLLGNINNISLKKIVDLYNENKIYECLKEFEYFTGKTLEYKKIDKIIDSFNYLLGKEDR